MLNSSRKLGYIHGTHMSSYFFLFSVTLLQYFVTCGSSPGYVIDAMRDVDETNAIMYRNAPTTSFLLLSKENQPQVPEDGFGLVTSLSLREPNTVMTVIDVFFSLIITVFGWELAWYICEESALCIWTLIMYIDYLTNVAKPWWKNAVIILLLVLLVISLIFVLLLLLFHSYLILTNQSTYELVRRKRIPYMRNMPERVHPFSRGIYTTSVAVTIL
ncbi:hypothetical protein HID58_042404 [Brassica napus]|uniref:Protein S-acyltransferase n=1 Tax=Brassica napus TaxID=3708 RepID=A0ABQ8BFC1_BRANA|nr:hypothetical protein HID58_042404 [Brassica napus]